MVYLKLIVLFALVAPIAALPIEASWNSTIAKLFNTREITWKEAVYLEFLLMWFCLPILMAVIFALE